MTPRERASAAPERGEVAALLEERGRLQEWLAKLESAGAGANPRVVERVRNDYADRLRGTLARLGEHLDALRAERDRVEARVSAAATAHEEAQEQLEEQRLRHEIGELEASVWEEREPGLSAEVERTAAELETLREEMRRLDDLLAQVREGEPAADADAPGSGEEPQGEPPPGEAVAAPDGDAGADAGTPVEADEKTRASEVLGEPLTELDAAGTVEVGEALEEEREEQPASDELAFLEGVASSTDDEETVEQGTRPSDLDFLMELDRAISAGGEAGAEAPAAAELAPESAPAPAAVGADENPEDYKPTPGVKCPECGYNNDPDAWYCGVCGVDLA